MTAPGPPCPDNRRDRPGRQTPQPDHRLGRTTVMPARIQRRCTPGWKRPANAVIVDRTSRFGNPFTVAECLEADMAESLEDARRYVTGLYRQWLDGELYGGPGPEGTKWSAAVRNRILADLPLLHGRDLACWCPLPEPGEPDHCHAAVLIALANQPA